MRNSGFTLIEMLLAFALMASVLSAMYALTFLSAKAWNRVRAESTAQQAVRAMVDRLTHDADQLVPLTSLPFKAEDGVLEFAAQERLPEDQSPALARIRFERVEAGDQVQLKRKVAFFNPRDGVRDVTVEDVFPMTMSEFSLEYPFEHETSSRSVVWRKEWKPEWGIPETIRMSFKPSGTPETQAALSHLIWIPYGRLGPAKVKTP
jgi:prepilin-type N-terminal cleavage/methylation domain-containing protein